MVKRLVDKNIGADKPKLEKNSYNSLLDFISDNIDRDKDKRTQLSKEELYNLACKSNMSSLSWSDYIKMQKKKSHSHQIVAAYIPRSLFKDHWKYLMDDDNIFRDAWKLLYFIDYWLSFIPFYTAFAVSVSGLLTIFLVFLHNYQSIFEYSNDGPVNPEEFYLFYFVLISYLTLFIHSIVKFLLQIFDEIRCPLIYNKTVHKQCILGIILFIISEAMLFFSFFWAFFHLSLSPNMYIGCCWPPIGITPLNPFHLPFLNTLILLLSGLSVNWFSSTLRRLNCWKFKYNSLYSISKVPSIIKVTFNLFFSKQRVKWLKEFFNESFYIFNTINLFVMAKQTIRLMFVTIIQFICLRFLQMIVKLIPLVIHTVLSRKSYSVYPRLSSILFSLDDRESQIVDRQAAVIMENSAEFSYVSIWLSGLKKLCYLDFFEKLTLTYNLISENLRKDISLLIYSIYIKYFKIVWSGFFYLEGLMRRYIIFSLSVIDELFFKKLKICLTFLDLYTSLLFTIYLGVLFISFQFVEYELYATFDVDNVYGSTFYSLTLLHGVHVFIGIAALTTCLLYFYQLEFKTSEISYGTFVNFITEFTIWYWHFVDVVWIILFITVYWWGS